MGKREHRTWIRTGLVLAVGVGAGWSAATLLDGQASEVDPVDRLPPGSAPRPGSDEPRLSAPTDHGRSDARPGLGADLANELAELRAENTALAERLAAYELDEAREQAALEALDEPLAWLRELAPDTFGDLTAEELLHMRDLVLSELPVTDDDLRHLQHLKSLESLTLRCTQVTDAGLAHLESIEGLEHLGLRETAVTDEGLVHVRAMPALDRLDLNMCAVTDAGVEDLSGLDLTFLRLNFTKVTDAGLVHLANMRKLQRVDLWGTAVTDGGLDHLLGHPSIEHLEVGATVVSRDWVEAFRAAHPDCYVSSPHGR